MRFVANRKAGFGAGRPVGTRRASAQFNNSQELTGYTVLLLEECAAAPRSVVRSSGQIR